MHSDKFPARHPYLAVTPEDVERAKERAARYPWAKETLKNLIQDARKRAARPLGKLPPKGDQAHWGIAAGLLQVGLGHAFSGDPQLATWVRDGLTAYAEGIKNIVIMGVHTNMCVLGRPFGIRAMVRLGRNVVLARDLTDAMYDPRQPPHVSHARGTELVVEHVEKYWCPSILSDDLVQVVPGSAGP